MGVIANVPSLQARTRCSVSGTPPVPRPSCFGSSKPWRGIVVEFGGADGLEVGDGVGGGVERLGLAGRAAAGSRKPLQLGKAGIGAARAAAPPSPETDVATAAAAVGTPVIQRPGHGMARAGERRCSRWKSESSS